MQKTKVTSVKTILVDTESLKENLGCGRPTAVSIGIAANARIKINRRVLWNVELIENYLKDVAE